MDDDITYFTLRPLLGEAGEREREREREREKESKKNR
jgi:hypothetical protein